MKPKATLYHDLRREKKNGTYPVKIRVYDPLTRKTKFFSTEYDLSTKDFSLVMESKYSAKGKEINFQLQSKLIAIQTLINETKPFSFDKLEGKIGVKNNSKNDVYGYLERKADKLKEEKKFKNSSLQIGALNSFKSFQGQYRKTNSSNLKFEEVNGNWLREYENFMVNLQGKSISTVGVYLRNLRAVFNEAIEDTPYLMEYYPFKKGIFTIPTSKRTKRALDKTQIATLYHYVPQSSGEEFAKDFWFASYFTFGINPSDLLRLKNQDILSGNIQFFRKKTRESRRAQLEKISVPITSFWEDFYNKYQSESLNPIDFALNVLDNNWDESRIDSHIHWVNKKIRKHLRSIAFKTSLPIELSVQWARHSFATQAIQNGASMELVGQSLGHTNTQTTKAYFSGFANDQKIELINNLI